ncbi:MAG: dTDP-4-dehydrorhamnose reductase [Proteobacteria bacterium]|nr:dTDP-4-dehydrorhamnose reductase [Pseudomonadota bacterium]
MTLSVAVFGSNGQLGRCIRDRLKLEDISRFRFLTRADADLSSAEEIDALFKRLDGRFDVLVNCAVMLDIDSMENDPATAELARRVNYLAPVLMAKEAVRTGALLINFSSDYVFGNGQTRPWREDDPCEPLNIYGRDKRDSELALLEMGVRALTIRPCWLYSEYGRNFVKTILRLAGERDTLDVVDDEIGSPTYTGDLADAVLSIISSPRLTGVTNAQVLQYCNSGAVSRCEFAREIIAQAGLKTTIRAVSSAQYGSSVRRPSYGCMSSARIVKEFGVQEYHWRDSLVKGLRRMGVIDAEDGR